MKRGIHPHYGPVVFQDANTGACFLTRSTLSSPRTIEWQTADGVHTYPLVVVEVSADSHPLWTGTQRTLGVAGRVERFYRRYGQRSS
ncbi:50S ribosomal protein L31 [Mycobacterium kubicae]|uniref:type B 50S ribosomal protein L31 n=1 Tax=Mycobacterium kubicae TaxID=120959 RepID=UPI000801428D|nr:type B 50S ribosomal protein L31 [Mycobacterium kubicae]OBF19209.1 50S ribosomal protein L31 [Mycobacterium kubicae]